jgi:hypothetical protein
MRTLLRKDDLRARYLLKTGRSVNNRVKAGTLPPPDFHVGEIPYWYQTTIEKHERKAAKAAAEAKRDPQTV